MSDAAVRVLNENRYNTLEASFAAFLAWLGHRDGELIELQTIEGRSDKRGPFAHGVPALARTASTARALELLLEADEMATGVYVMLNPVDIRLIARARADAWIVSNPRISTSNKDVTARRVILVDFDPERPSGVSSTNAEHISAFLRARLFLATVRENAAAIASSGNGFHVLVLVDVPNTDATDDLCKRLLEAAKVAFSGGKPAIKVDAGVHDRKRVTAAYGTTKRKGEDSTTLPHRRTWFGALTPTTRPLDLCEFTALVQELEARAADMRDIGDVEHPDDSPPKRKKGEGRFHRYNRLYELPELLERLRPGQALTTCVFCGAANAVFNKAGNNVKCHHDTCSQKAYGAVSLVAKLVCGYDALKGQDLSPVIKWFAETFGEDDLMVRDFGDLLPLFEVPNLPTFPVNALSGAFRRYVEEVATQIQVPVDAIAMIELAIMSMVLARKVVIEHKGHREHPMLMVAVALAVGNRKSSIIKRATRAAKEWQDAMVPLVATERAIAERAIAVMEKRLKACDADESTDDETCRQLLRDLQASRDTMPAIPKLLVSDSTEEALQLDLHEQAAIAIADSEGGAMLSILTGKYTGGRPGYETLLRGWSGDDFRVSRVNKARNLDIRSPRLAIAVLVQPSVLDRVVTDSEDFRDQGVAARFAWILPRSLLGERDMNPSPASREMIQWHDDLIKQLLDVTQRLPDDLAITLAPETIAVFDRFESWLEPQFKTRFKFISDLGSKLAWTILRYAAALHAFEHGAACLDRPLALDTFRSACVVAEYVFIHSEYVILNIFDRHGLDRELLAVRDWLRDQKREVFVREEIYTLLYKKHRTRARETIDRVLYALEERRWILPIDQDIKFAVHPSAVKLLREEYALRNTPNAPGLAEILGVAPLSTPAANGVHEPDTELDAQQAIDALN